MAVGFEVAGAGVYLPAPEQAMGGSVWGVAEEYGDARLDQCRAFMPVPGILQTVQRAELWGAIVALSGSWIMAVWLSLCLWSRTGSCVAIAQYMIQARREDTVH